MGYAQFYREGREEDAKKTAEELAFGAHRMVSRWLYPELRQQWFRYKDEEYIDFVEQQVSRYNVIKEE